jgi:hypothetical protein
MRLVPNPEVISMGAERVELVFRRARVSLPAVGQGRLGRALTMLRRSVPCI